MEWVGMGEVGLCCEVAEEMIVSRGKDKKTLFQLLLQLLYRPEEECLRLALRVAVQVWPPRMWLPLIIVIVFVSLVILIITLSCSMQYVV